jgi:hypothetical protein
MEAPVKVIHRDLKSRNGNVFMCFCTYFITNFVHLCMEVSIMLFISSVTCLSHHGYHEKLSTIGKYQRSLDYLKMLSVLCPNIT